MNLLVVAGAAAVVGSVLLIWWSVSGDTTDSLDLGGPSPPSWLSARASAQPGASDRLAKPGFERIGRFIRNWAPTGRVTSLERKLVSAGSPPGWSVDRLLAVKLMLSLVLVGLTALVVEFTTLGVLLVIAAAVVGFLVPDALLTRQIDARNLQIRRELADVIDQVSMMVRAGLGIGAALPGSTFEHRPAVRRVYSRGLGRPRGYRSQRRSRKHGRPR